MENKEENKEVLKRILAIFREGYNRGLGDMIQTNLDPMIFYRQQKTNSIRLPTDEMERLLKIFVGELPPSETVKVERISLERSG